LTEDILEFCEYESAFDLLSDHMTQAELSDFLQDLVNSPQDAVDFVKEEVMRIAKDLFEWVDRDALIAQAEDMKYQKYRDGE
tara:strand:- start:2651 stop:2896 length:246 start_codon:yes stop_codon:yes gene_type:complete